MYIEGRPAFSRERSQTPLTIIASCRLFLLTVVRPFAALRQVEKCKVCCMYSDGRPAFSHDDIINVGKNFLSTLSDDSNNYFYIIHECT
jgi:hypothetical protein